jgi:hypothetical protein
MQSSHRRTPRRQQATARATKGKPVDPYYLRDGERGAQPAIKNHPKRMAMQAAPDHGDHE